jgi:hypothetical protein
LINCAFCAGRGARVARGCRLCVNRVTRLSRVSRPRCRSSTLHGTLRSSTTRASRGRASGARRVPSRCPVVLRFGSQIAMCVNGELQLAARGRSAYSTPYALSCRYPYVSRNTLDILPYIPTPVPRAARSRRPGPGYLSRALSRAPLEDTGLWSVLCGWPMRMLGRQPAV